MDSIKSLLAASGGDTVKLFDLSLEPRDPCILSYTPSPGFLINSLKWNVTSQLIQFILFQIFNSFLGFNFGCFGCCRFSGGKRWRRQEDIFVEEKWTEFGDSTH